MTESHENPLLMPVREWTPAVGDSRQNLMLHDKTFNDPKWLFSGFSRHRDSDLAVQSNFEAAIGLLKDAGLEEEKDWTIFHFNHWAVGWAEALAVYEDSGEAVRVVVEALERLSDYAVLDEEELSQRENDAANEGWENWGLEQFQAALGHSFVMDGELLDALNDRIPSEKWLQWLNAEGPCYFRDGDGGYSIDSFMESLETRQFLNFLEEHLGEDNWPPVQLFFSGDSDPEDFRVPDPNRPGMLTEMPFLTLISKAYHDQGRPPLEHWPEEWSEIPPYVPGEKEQPTLEL